MREGFSRLRVTLVRQTIQQRGRHAFALEDLYPIAKRQVARHQQTLALVAVGE